MSLALNKIEYGNLNSRQKENYNFYKIAAILADYGYVSLRLSDDWNGADFIAVHIDGETVRLQLKGRFGFYKKYIGKDLYIAFCAEGEWYLYPHDAVLKYVLAGIENSTSWVADGEYHFPYLTPENKNLMAGHRVPVVRKP
jgi:hypothetical protein